MRIHRAILLLTFLIFANILPAQPVIYTVEYGPKPASPPSLTPVFVEDYKGLKKVNLVVDNWYYASRARADAVKADAFIIPGGSTSDVPFYDGRLDSYVELLRNPGRPALGFCAGIQFLMMARGGICARRSGEHGNQSATIFGWDEIFEGCPNPYTDRAAHNYSIVDIPDEFINLATTRTCYPTFARHLTMPLYGSQLHIESMNNPNSAGPAVIANFQNNIMTRKFHGVAEVFGFPAEPGKVLVTWWQVKTEADVIYRIYQATADEEIDFNTPVAETRELEYEITGLNPDLTYQFAVRAACSAFTDSNKAIYPIKPDGHREIVFQNGRDLDGTPYDDCEATVIYEKYPNSNFGKLGSLGTADLYWLDCGLVQFKNLHHYLSGKKVIGGKLTFIFVGGVDETTNASHIANIAIYRVLKQWNEGRGINSSTALTGEVSWNSAQHNQIPWEIPGGQGTTDRATEPIARYTIKGDGTGIAFDGTVELPARLIQTWIDKPDSNCGLLYEKTDTYPSAQSFYFEDNDDEWFMNHPRLTVYCLDAEPVLVKTETQNPLPKTVELFPNYPNPFNSATVIPIRVVTPQYGELLIYNINGQFIKRLFNGYLDAGEHKITWNGCDAFGNAVSSGVYLYKLKTGDTITVKRMLLIR